MRLKEEREHNRTQHRGHIGIAKGDLQKWCGGKKNLAFTMEKMEAEGWILTTKKTKFAGSTERMFVIFNRLDQRPEEQV